ncbi:MAG: site-specific integrase, partial [Jiangellaceae bacterium]
MKGSVKRYCSCKGSDGKQLGGKCPQLSADSKHGHWELRDRLPTTAGIKPFRRRSMATKTAANKFRGDVYAILDLAQGDQRAREKLGDLVFAATNRGGQLPAIVDVRRRLGLGLALDRSQTVGEWLDFWLANKRKAGRRDSTLDSYEGHVRNFLRPHLGDISLDRLQPEHIHDLLDLIEERNVEIELARTEGRRPNLPGDERRRKAVTGATTQRRIFATLRNSLNAAWKMRRIDVNPCAFVEMPDETRVVARVWSPEQVGQFLEHVEDDMLYIPFRLVLLHGLRRGEVTGLRWSDMDLDEMSVEVTRPLVKVGGRTVESKPKTTSGERIVDFDKETADLLKRHRTQQKRDRLAASTAWIDDDLVFCRADGSAINPDLVSRRFKQLITDAGLPMITLHMGRHTAATLALEAGVDVKIVSARLGHSKASFTQNTYQHVRRTVQRGAVDA